MSNVPIVQGVTVSGQQHQQSSSPYSYHQAPADPAAAANPVSDGYKAEYDHARQALTEALPNDVDAPPPKQCNDVFWAVLFVAHLVAVLVVIGIGMSQADLSSGTGYGNIIFMVSVSALAAVVLSTFCLTFMMKNAEILVQTALLFSVCSGLAIGIVGFMTGSMLMGFIGIGSFVIGCCYAKMVWNRIPFAAANLKTALTAVQANLGLAVVAYAFTGIAFVWTVLWFLGVGQSLSNNTLAIVFLLFVSYYWVHQVLQNTVHVTT